MEKLKVSEKSQQMYSMKPIIHILNFLAVFLMGKFHFFETKQVTKITIFRHRLKTCPYYKKEERSFGGQTYLSLNLRDKERKQTLEQTYNLRNKDWKYWECEFDALVKSHTNFKANHVNFIQFLHVNLRNAVLPGFIGTFELKWIKVRYFSIYVTIFFSFFHI